MHENRLNVLAIDDDPADLVLLQCELGMVREWKTELTGSRDWSTAEERLVQDQIDLVFLDYLLGADTGLDVLRTMRRSGYEHPVIVLTGQGSERVAAEITRAGADDYLVKGDLNPDLLTRSIRYALEHKRRQAESRKRKQEQQQALIEEERLKVLLQMAGATVHELEQPLTGILLCGELLKSETDCPPQVRELVDPIVECAEGMRSIVSRMQTIKRCEAKPFLDSTSIIDFDQDYRILLVEDREEDARAVQAMLSPYGDRLTLDRVRDCQRAAHKARSAVYDLVLADYRLPDGTCLDLLDRLREEEHCPPFVMITSNGNEALAAEAMRRGVYDYLPKAGLDRTSLLQAIRATLERSRLEREIELAQKKVAELATQDGLTGCFNRRYIMEVLDREVERARRYGMPLTLAMIDLDHFKQINDRFGHDVGDVVLQRFADLLRETMRNTDYAGRYGGEEFMVILTNTPLESARTFADRFREKVSATWFEAGETHVQVTCSAGLSQYTDTVGDASALLKLADEALYRAKDAGRNTVCCSRPKCAPGDEPAAASGPLIPGSSAKTA